MKIRATNIDLSGKDMFDTVERIGNEITCQHTIPFRPRTSMMEAAVINQIVRSMHEPTSDSSYTLMVDDLKMKQFAFTEKDEQQLMPNGAAFYNGKHEITTFSEDDGEMSAILLTINYDMLGYCTAKIYIGTLVDIATQCDVFNGTPLQTIFQT